jgi:hypothetical protein
MLHCRVWKLIVFITVNLQIKTAKTAIADLLDVPPLNRASRVKEFIKCMTVPELNSVLPFLSKHVSVFDFLKEKSRQTTNPEISTSRLWFELQNLSQ